MFNRLRVPNFIQNDSTKYVVGITAGIVFGIILNAANAGHVLSTLLTIPGPLFLRSLQCAVIPMMFFNISISVAEIYGNGKAGTLGKKVLFFYFLTTMTAVLNGIVMSNIFSPLLSRSDDDADDDGADVEMKCPKSYGKMTVDQSGVLMCIKNDNLDMYNLTSKYQTFNLLDSENKLLNDAIRERTLLEQVMSTFESLVPNNVIQSFATPNIISVIIIAIIFGAAMVHVQNTEARQYQEENAVADNATDSTEAQRSSLTDKSHKNVVHSFTPGAVLDLCKEMTVICNLIIRWIVKLAPVCIAFLIAGSLAEAGNLVSLLQNVGTYCLSTVVGIVIHLLVTLPVIFYLYTRENAYLWLYSCRKAVLVALSTSSSAVTLPISIECVVSTGKVSAVLANVILPMGANINMDGAAISFPCAIMFMANAVGVAGDINASTWVNIALGSSLGSVGAAPVPSAGMVTLITVWQTAFPSEDVPDAIAYVQAIDFFVDRIGTMTNVCSDLIIMRMLQVLIDSEVEQEKANASTARESIIELEAVKNTLAADAV